EVIRMVEGPHFSVRFFAILFGAGVVIAAYVAIRRRSHLVSAEHVMPERYRLETALMAGLLATATMSIAVDLILYALAAVDRVTPAAALFELARIVGQRFRVRPAVETLILGIAVYVWLQLLWAILYAHVERWLPEPDWLGGLLFSLLPF